ncbi:MAG: hypothetical protein E7480_05845 [Ruminococcaceae bacterium]|nr:hypothetical protein [Oscillospiraceae bacterium]
MKKLSFSQINGYGDVGYRAIKSLSRLESKIYQPEYVRKMEQETPWPSDWIGRTLLGVVMLSKATGVKGAYLERLLELVDELENEKGYLGEVQEGIYDEQQLSSHNWLLRALLEYYDMTGDKKILKKIWTIVENLYLPVKNHYIEYPTNKEDRVYTGEKSGTLTGAVINNWKTSSDTGCAYMCLDALSQMYEMFPDERVKVLLEEMISTFEKIDFVKISMQTHATLAATRGIVRFYAVTGKEEYLDFAKNLFKLYLDYGATPNYANFNWFCRHEWTEPCAITDSYLLCFEMFIQTKDIYYLKTASRIYYNAFSFAQRYNGGFGCDICIGPEERILRADADSGLCEAFWCCTMRGADGISNYIRNSFVSDEKTLYFTQYIDSCVKLDGLKIEERSEYPKEGKISIKAVMTDNTEIDTIALYVPDFAKGSKLIVNGKEQSISNVGGFEMVKLSDGENSILLTFDIPIYTEKALGKLIKDERFCFWRGDLIIGVETDKCLDEDNFEIEYIGNGKCIDKKSGLEFVDLTDNINIEPTEKSPVKSIQVLFGK